MITKANLNAEQQRIRQISDRIVTAQQSIRILDAIKWDDSIKNDFFKQQCQALPNVDHEYYLKRPLAFDADATILEFRQIIRAIKNDLGQYSGVSKIMIRMCEEYCKAIQMLQARGTPLFSQFSLELYGAPDDAFYPGGPRQSELGALLGDILKHLDRETASAADEKRYNAEEAVVILQKRLSEYFHVTDRVTVQISDNIVADAAAGADCIRLNSQVKFSDRDLRYLEVHEGWVHVGTTLNGLSQPICTFLSKGSPASSITQEGLAVLTEVVTFSSYPRRMLKITNRVRALELIAHGANFLDIFQFFRSQGLNDNEAYTYSSRLFRGSTPEGGAFTKDLSYTKGFILIYNYVRLAVQKGLIDRIPLFFVGKTLIEDIQILAELHEQGLLTPPRYLPNQFKDLAALGSWMGFSLFLNKFDLEAVAKHYKYLF
ncbi:MAG: hypothetical protein A3F41_04850 [Coxiella sp. RIFCSPHIGHO2_12_FULL_44_14]|nr:MAG: hypothetical protein A3F41_04850 [Coxiella sp. RIFCSPHIGHO2_12_FULL_44_14]